MTKLLSLKIYHLILKVTWPRGYKTFFMLNSNEHEHSFITSGLGYTLSGGHFNQKKIVYCLDRREFVYPLTILDQIPLLGYYANSVDPVQRPQNVRGNTVCLREFLYKMQLK